MKNKPTYFFNLKNSLFRITAFVVCILFAGNLSAGNLYWISGTGNWDDPTHWSATSGGAAGAVIPTSADNVFFDANSFTTVSKVLTLNVAASCNSMDWTGAAFTPILMGSVQLDIYGSLTLVSAMNNNFTGAIYFKSTSIGKTISTAGKTFASEVYFDGIGGAWTLQDAFNTTGNIFLDNGTLNTGNKNMTGNSFLSCGNSVRALSLGSSTITLNGTTMAYSTCLGGYYGWGVTGANYSLDAGTSTIKILAVNYGHVIVGNSDSYNNIIFQDITGSNNSLTGGIYYNSVIFNGPGTTTSTGASFTLLKFLKEGTTNGNGNSYTAVTFTGISIINGNNNAFPNLNFPQTATISGTNNAFGIVNFTQTATINGSNHSYASANFSQVASLSGGGHSFGKATFIQNATINNNNSFDSLFFTAGMTYTLGSNNIQTINNYFMSDGSCSLPVIIASTVAGTQATINSSLSNITANYIRVKDINATGGAVFTANSSTDLGNNTGWTINVPAAQNLYWIAGSGNWNDPTHWSNTSGGTTSGCIPTKYDNVFFDANSFTVGSKNLTMNVAAACNDMNWTGAAFTPTFMGSTQLDIYGSLTLVSAMNNNFTGTMYFKSTNIGKTVSSAGKVFASEVYFDGIGGAWTLQDAFNTTGNIFLDNGTLTTNNKNMTGNSFLSCGNNVRGLILGSSIITLNGAAMAYSSCLGGYYGWGVTGTNYSLDAGTSTIKILAVNYGHFIVGNLDNYYNIIFQDNTGSNNSLTGGSYYNSVIFNGPGTTTNTGTSFTLLKFFNSATTNGNGNSYTAVTFTGISIINGNNNSFPNLNFPQTATINGTNNAFGIVNFTQTASITGSNHSYASAKFMQAATITGGHSFVKATFLQNGSMTAGNNSFDSLLFAAGKTYTLGNNNTQTINSYLLADGTCGSPTILTSSVFGLQASINSANNITVNYIRMTDINSTGGGNFTANNATDISNNTGWNMNTASGQNLYWRGGTGNWNNPARWSTTSGGAAGTCIPTIYDNVFFDANSFTSNGSKTVTINVTAYCKSMNWTGATLTPNLLGTADLYVYGSLKLITGMNNNYTGIVIFKSVDLNTIITSAGKVFNNDVYFDGIAGEWILQDAFNTTGNIFLTNGILNTNNKNLTGNSFLSCGNNIRELILGSSTITMNGTAMAYSTCLGGYYGWGVTGTNYGLDAGTSTIKILAVNYGHIIVGSTDSYYNIIFQDVTGSNNSITGGIYYNSVIFYGPGTTNTNIATFESLKFMKDGTTNGNNNSFIKANFMRNGALNGNNNYDSLLFTPGYTYTLAASQTQTVGYLSANGTCSQSIVITTNSGATPAIISSAVLNLTVNYVTLNYITATGGAIFTANNSVSNGTNTGWAINTTAPVAGYNDSQNGLAASFSNTSTAATSYNWNFGDGTTSTLQNPMHTYNLGGNYNVCLTASNPCGVSDVICKTINVGCTIPVASYATNINGMSVSFTNNSTNAATVLWKFGDATSSTSPNPVHAYYNSGTYAVCLIVSNGCGVDSICQNVTVTCAPPVASYYYSVNGMTVNFTNISTNASVSNWTFGDSQTSTQNSPSHVYNVAGTYNVKLKITNGCGKDSLTQSITVVCAAPVSNFITNPQGLSADFVSTSSDATNVSWDFGDSSPASILPSLNHTYATTGTYTVCLTANNGCGTNTYCTPVSVCAPPVANFTETTSASTVSFTNTSTNGINYYWTFSDANASNSVSPTHIYSASGTYNVCLVASNSCGSNTFCKTVQTSCTQLTNQQICEVTVDPLSTHTIIIWEKPAVAGVDSFRVYREVNTGVYSNIASVSYDSLSEYHDYGANPNVTSYRYKLTVIDTCGNESLPADWSDFHSTIHLQNLGGGNLQWTLYDIENAGNPVTYYRVYRDDNNSGNFLPISSTIPGGNSTFTDVNSGLYPNASYRVDVAWSILCTSTRASVNTTRSNIKHQTMVTGINSKEALDATNVYPNPATDYVSIEFMESIQKAEIRIMNSIGQIVYEQTVISSGNSKTTKQINTGSFAKGIYTIAIETNASKTFKKLVIN